MALPSGRVEAGSGCLPAPYARATDDTGIYRLFGLQPGRYYVSVRPDEERPSLQCPDTSPTSLAPTYYPSTAVASEAQPIDVVAGVDAVADIALVATQVTTVSGEVVDAAGRGRRRGRRCSSPATTSRTAAS